MIPEIGIMIAAYTLTRMTQIIGLPSERANGVAKALAVIGLLVTALVAFDLFIAGTKHLNLAVPR